MSDELLVKEISKVSTEDIEALKKALSIGGIITHDGHGELLDVEGLDTTMMVKTYRLLDESDKKLRKRIKKKIKEKSFEVNENSDFLKALKAIK